MQWTDFSYLNRHDQIHAVTKEELERRLALVRGVMREKGTALFLLPSCRWNSLSIWLTGSEHPDMLLVPLEGKMVKVYGPENLSPDALAFRPEREDPLGLCMWADSIDFGWIASLAAACGGRIGYDNAEPLESGFLDSLRAAVPNLELVPMSDDISLLKAAKSPFEQELVWASARMHQKILEAVPAVLRVGRTMKEVSDELRWLAIQMGSTGEDMCLMIHIFDPDGRPQDAEFSAYPGRRFTASDITAVLMETNGPGGMFHAVCRYFAFGEPSAEFRERYRVAVEANRLVGQLMCPGNTIRNVADTVNNFIRSHGYYTDDCCYLHGMGYTMWEFPAIADNTYEKHYQLSEDLPLQAGMISLAHPHVGHSGNRYTIRDEMIRCIDSYIVAPGGAVRGNTLTQDIIRL